VSIKTITGKSDAYVITEWRERHPRADRPAAPPLDPAITFSYQTGAGMREIAPLVAQLLEQTEFQERHPWTIYDQQLLEKALQENLWPRELAARITEDKRLFLDELVDDLFGLRPPSWVLVPQLVKTILRLAVSGHAILVGYGVTVVTAGLPNVFHVRLTGSLPRRIARIQQRQQLAPEAAARFVRNKDRGRARFVKAHFHARLDDEMRYDLVLNTDHLSAPDAAAVIAAAAHRFFSAKALSLSAPDGKDT
jgi:hypothetical protein